MSLSIDEGCALSDDAGGVLHPPPTQIGESADGKPLSYLGFVEHDDTKEEQSLAKTIKRTTSLAKIKLTPNRSRNWKEDVDACEEGMSNWWKQSIYLWSG